MIRSRPTLRHAAATALAALLPAAAARAAPPLQESAADTPAATEWRPGKPAKLYEVARVVDGDTIHVLRDGELEKLRLLSVDTEERLTGSFRGSRTKPQTVFGEECALWAQELFAGLAEGDAPVGVGLVFPGGVEARDVYGRLLCHVVLPDGTDFNLLLVELGKSPYFDKYGPSELCHEAFEAAERRARAARRGIWDPATNRPASPDAPSARRPYEELMPWWDARSAAVAAFRRRHAEEPARWVAADDPGALERALGREVELFGEINRFYEEENGDRTVLFRSGARDAALRIVIPAAARAAHDALDLDGARAELRQNYLYVRGTPERGPRGFRVVSAGPEGWRRAGPEPAVAKPATAR